MLSTQETYDELRSVMNHYHHVHVATEAARTDHATIERQIGEIRRAYSARLYEEIAASPELKVKFSNQERRDAEVQRRLEADIPEMLHQELEAHQHRQNLTAELERSEQALKTMRVLAGLVEVERRMETVMADVATMPRIVAGRR